MCICRHISICLCMYTNVCIIHAICNYMQGLSTLLHLPMKLVLKLLVQALQTEDLVAPYHSEPLPIFNINSTHTLADEHKKFLVNGMGGALILLHAPEIHIDNCGPMLPPHHVLAGKGSYSLSILHRIHAVTSVLSFCDQRERHSQPPSRRSNQVHIT
jgi:hypothetical protein